jgi:hypothetical protein
MRELGNIDAVIIALALATSTPSILPLTLPAALVLHTYEARIQLNGKVSTTQVQASDAGQAKKLVQAQFPTATVLSIRKVDCCKTIVTVPVDLA